MHTLPRSLDHSLTRLCSAALPSIQLYNGLAISFFLSFDLAFGGAWIAIDLAQWCSSFYRRRGRDGRVIVIAIIIDDA